MTLLQLTSHLNGFHSLNPQSPTLSSISRVSVLISHGTQLQNLVICARRKKRVGHRRITRILLNSLSFLSPHLSQPLDLVIADLGGVDSGGGGRGGLGFWRGWGSSDGWRRKKNKVPILVIVCVILWIRGFCKISGKEIKRDQVLKVSGLCSFGLAMVNELKREARFLIFGFLCFIASLVLDFKNGNFVKLDSGVRSCSSGLLGRRRSRRRV